MYKKGVIFSPFFITTSYIIKHAGTHINYIAICSLQFSDKNFNFFSVVNELVISVSGVKEKQKECHLFFQFVVADNPNVPTLTELASKCVASHIPFELVERFYPPVPEQLQLRIAYWSFPDNEEDIRLYSCLANGAADEFSRGEHLVRSNMVRDPLQIGKNP